MDEPPRALLTRSEFLFLVFTLLSAGVIGQARTTYYVYGADDYGGAMYGGTLF